MYRYSMDEHNASLLAMGRIRVGTLHDFRNSEHKKGIADPQEGTKEVSHFIDYFQADKSFNQDASSCIHARAMSVMGLEFKNSNITVNNVKMSRSFDQPDCFVFCTSLFRSRETMNEFEGANSCIEITNPEAFYTLLTETINAETPVEFRGVHKVTYQDRSERWNGRDWGNHPALIKETEFKKQVEIRAIWEPRFRQQINPIIVANYELSIHCRAATI